MAHYDLEEQEQLDALKAWWNTYGNYVSGAILLVALSLLAWNSFSWFEYKKANEAALLYQQFNAAIHDKDSARVTALAGELIHSYPKQAYATLAAMEAGAFSLENKDNKTAQQQLSWAAEKGEKSLKDLAKLRLAHFFLMEQQWEKALDVLKNPQSMRFLPAFLDLKGDIYWAQNKTQEALKVWKEAQTKIAADLQLQNALASLNEAILQKIAAIAQNETSKNEKNSESTVDFSQNVEKSLDVNQKK